MEKLNSLLDRVFPIDTSADVLTVASIRFLPTFANESQVTIIRYRKTAKIIHFKAQRNVYDVIQIVTSGGKNPADQEIASSVNVEKQERTLSTRRADQLLNSLFMSCSKSLLQMRREEAREIRANQVGVYLDGTYYEFLTEPKMNDVRISIYDVYADRTVMGNFDFTALANTLRIQLERKTFK